MRAGARAVTLQLYNSQKFKFIMGSEKDFSSNQEIDFFHLITYYNFLPTFFLFIYLFDTPVHTNTFGKYISTNTHEVIYIHSPVDWGGGKIHRQHICCGVRRHLIK